MEESLNDQADWLLFETHFNSAHQNFIDRLRQQYSDITTGELTYLLPAPHESFHQRNRITVKRISPCDRITTVPVKEASVTRQRHESH